MVVKQVTIILYIILSVAFMSCDQDIDGPSQLVLGEGIYILNEGNFQQANASVSYFNPAKDTVAQEVFSRVNGSKLGDVGQSILQIGDLVYIVVNNSQKIEVCEASTFKRQKTITGFDSPRYILPVTNDKVYVTDLFANGVYVVNVSSGAIEKKISVLGWTEAVWKKDAFAYITAPNTDQLFIIDTQIDAIVDSIKISLGGSGIVEDKTGRLWVLCGGDYVTKEKPALHYIDPAKKELLRTFVFEGAFDYPTRLNINSTLDSLMYINVDVFKMGIQESKLPNFPLIQAKGRNFYSMSILKDDDVLCIGDAKDFTQNGEVVLYSSQGHLMTSFPCGIIPTSFLFK